MKPRKTLPRPAQLRAAGISYTERRARLVKASELLSSVATKKHFRPAYKRNTPMVRHRHNTFWFGDDVRAVIIGPYLCFGGPENLVPDSAERMTEKQRRHLGIIAWRLLITVPSGFAGVETFVSRIRSRLQGGHRQ